jgi:hypothetical protein
VRSAVASSKVQRSVCSNESCVCIVNQGSQEFLRVVETHVDEATIALREKLVGSGNIHALVVGVEKSKTELNRVLSIDVGGVSDREGLVIAGGGLESGRIGVPSHHLFGSLLSEGLASRIKVGDVANELSGGADGLGDYSADGGGTSRDENSSGDWLALAKAIAARLERDSGEAVLRRDSGTVDNSRAAGNSGDDGGERRHPEKSQTWSSRINLGNKVEGVKKKKKKKKKKQQKKKKMKKK